MYKIGEVVQLSNVDVELSFVLNVEMLVVHMLNVLKKQKRKKNKNWKSKSKSEINRKMKIKIKINRKNQLKKKN